MNILLPQRLIALCLWAAITGCAEQKEESVVQPVTSTTAGVESQVVEQEMATAEAVKKSEAGSTTINANENTAEVRDEILASLDGSQITVSQLVQELETIFGREQIAQLPASTKKQVLETLVFRRSVSEQLWKELDSTTRLALENDFNAYRERELLRLYIEQQNKPTIVTNEMVEQYYRDHPEKFGASVRRFYQLAFAGEGRKLEQAEALIEEMGALQKTESFKDNIADLQQRYAGVVYQEGALNPDLYPGQVTDQLQNLTLGEVRFFIHNGAPFLVKLTDMEQTPPDPLASVQARIRHELATAQVRQTMQGIMDSQLGQINVEYADRVISWGERSASAQ